MIAILTDFGETHYVGVMKGILGDSHVIDLTHEVLPQHVRQGSWILKTTYSYFPKGTIFLCVVDPGVGSKRQAVAIQTKNYFFVGPDNGLMYPASQEEGIRKVVKLDTENASNTFHGRDIFAGAASMLDKGVKLSKLGPDTELEEEITYNPEGEVVDIDRFGNIVTNIMPTNRAARYKGETLPLINNYAEAEGMSVIVGSAGTMEDRRQYETLFYYIATFSTIQFASFKSNLCTFTLRTNMFCFILQFSKSSFSSHGKISSTFFNLLAMSSTFCKSSKSLKFSFAHSVQ